MSLSDGGVRASRCLFLKAVGSSPFHAEELPCPLSYVSVMVRFLCEGGAQGQTGKGEYVSLGSKGQGKTMTGVWKSSWGVEPGLMGHGEGLHESSSRHSNFTYIARPGAGLQDRVVGYTGWGGHCGMQARV